HHRALLDVLARDGRPALRLERALRRERRGRQPRRPRALRIRRRLHPLPRPRLVRVSDLQRGGHRHRGRRRPLGARRLPQGRPPQGAGQGRRGGQGEEGHEEEELRGRGGGRMIPQFGSLFGEPIPAYFAMLMTGFIVSFGLLALYAKRTGLDHDVIIDLGLVTLIAGVAVARILHVFVDGYFWDYVHLCTDPSLVAWEGVTRAECVSEHYNGVWDAAAN